jgi:hypothetical protein
VAEGGAGGGSLSLLGLLDKHAGEVTADFLRYYGVDIRDLFRPGGDLSPKRAIALVEHLPIDSALAAALRGGPAFLGWDRHSYLLADIYDALSLHSFITLKVNSQNPRRVEKPESYPRPDEETEKKEDDILLRRLRGEKDAEPTDAVRGRVVPLPPSR